MERWGVRERVCAVELFISTGSITETQRGFRLERNQQEAREEMKQRAESRHSVKQNRTVTRTGQFHNLITQPLFQAYNRSLSLL
jgi:hypothetical protein